MTAAATSSGHVGPVIFADETARAQLLRGEVVSFRSRSRTTGETWARWSRQGEKQADVTIEELTAIAALREDEWADPLEHYWKLSGFASPDDWRAAIREHHSTGDGYLYLVRLPPVEILTRLAAGEFAGSQALDADVKPSAVRVAQVADPTRPGEAEDLEPRHVVDVMRASAGRVAVVCKDATDGTHWYRYRPWDDQWEDVHVGPGLDDSSVTDHSPAWAFDEHILIEESREVSFVRPSATRHWDWTWAKRLVVAADRPGGEP